ncbi:MAG: hypothetical protein IPL39_10610 [Opitutaceae bacterium]|nr:hypothetical protein [Opitutaceae bacterium]
MTFFAYLTILRPVRTLLVTLLVVLIATAHLAGVLRGHPSEEILLFVFAAVGPLIVGALLFGPFRELMSRNFFPTLPSARRSLRRWHIATVTATALVLLLAASRALPGIPRATMLGLIVAGLTLPLLNDARRPSAAAGWLRALLLIALVLSTRPLAAAVGPPAQWATLAAGVACVVLGFHRGFAAPKGQDRQPCFSLQSQLPIPGSGFVEIMRCAQADKARFAARKTTRRTCAWTVTSVSSSLRDWVAVLHHARLGHGSRFGSLLGHAATGGLVAIICPVAIFFLGRRDFGDGSTYVAWCRELAEASRFGPAGKPPSSDFGASRVAMSMMILMIASGTTAITTKLFPLSRRRLASAVFAETIRLGASAWLGYAFTLFAGVALAGRVAGIPLTADSFAGPLLDTLLTPPLWLGALAFLFLVGRWLGFFGLLATYFLFILTSGVVTGIISAMSVYFRFLPFGPLVWLGITAVAGYLCWLALQGHLRRCDLTRPPAWAKLFNSGL